MVVTKADVYEQMIFAERPVCPHCGKEMKIWECIESGSCRWASWGTPYFFLCVNDECPPFRDGWKSTERGLGRKHSYRCVGLPDSRTTEIMMVGSLGDCNSGVVDEEVVAADRMRGTSEDPAVQVLIRSFESKDVNILLDSLFDDKTHYRVRKKAAELIGELGLVETLESLIDHRFMDQRVATEVERAIKRIHEINHSRECPYCANVIAADAGMCQTCGRELSEK